MYNIEHFEGSKVKGQTVKFNDYLTGMIDYFLVVSDVS